MKSSERIELRCTQDHLGDRRWKLTYFTRMGSPISLADYGHGNLQAAMMINGARQAVKWKLLDDFEIIAPAEEHERLLRMFPDLVDNGK